MRKLLLLALAGVLSVIMLAGTVPASMAVLGGESVDWSKHTEIAKLEIGSGGSFCTGSFLTDEWLLTAAHCVTSLDYGIAGNPNNGGEHCERATFDLDNSDCYLYANQAGPFHASTVKASPADFHVSTGLGQRFAVAQVEVHPAFDWVVDLDRPRFHFSGCLSVCAKVLGLDYVAWDFALVRLAKLATGIGHVRLADDTSQLKGGLKLTMYGFGDTDPTSGRSFPSGLRASPAGKLELVGSNYPTCNPGADPSTPRQSAVLCAAALTSDAGQGQGDSGGPWFATLSDGTIRQVGVTSFGPVASKENDEQGIKEFATASHPDQIASPAAALRWIRSKTGLTDGTSAGADNVATALVIDNSGSMDGNDPDAVRADAAVSYVNTAVPGDRIGVVGFEDSAYDIADVAALPAGRDTLVDAIRAGVHAGGGTDIGSGVASACQMLQASGLPAKRAAILMTDGDGGYTDEASCFTSHGWRIFTIGLGSGVNADLLTQIAEQTGGTYQPVPAPFELQCTFQQVRALAAGGNAQPCQSSTIAPQQTLAKKLSVAPRLSQVTFATTWPGSDVEMSLVSPSGRVVDRDTDAWDVKHTVASTHEEYVVTVPEPGEWTVRLYGADVDPAGEPVELTSGQVPFDNDPPTVSGTAALVGERTWSFKAQAADPDGTVSGVVWDFGDGSKDAGTALVHTYPGPGSYTPSVTAVDDKGETATTTLPEVVVAQPAVATVATFKSTVDGLGMKVDASASTGPGSLQHAWDFDGDGAAEVTSGSPTTAWTYPAAGTYEVSLGVLAGDGTSATTRTQVRVAGHDLPSITVKGRPKVVGTAKVGHVLRATLPKGKAKIRFTPKPASVSGEWVVDGQVRSHKASYRLRPVDAGLPVRYRLVATRDGYAPGYATSKAKQVARLKSKTKANFSAMKAGVPGQVTVAVTSAAPEVAGMVTVSEGKQVLGKATLTASDRGRVKIGLSALGAGKHTLRVVFNGSVPVTPSSVKSKVTVTDG